MPDTLRPLLAGIIDYAGTFPPAALALDDAVRYLRQYRTEPEAWLLGRSIFPAAKLVDLARLSWNEADGKLSVLVPGAATEADFFVNLKAARTAIDSFPIARFVDTLEMLWPADAANANSFANLLGRLELPETWTAFFEFAAPDPSDDAFARQATAAAAALAEANVRVGFKIRTGGANPASIPSPKRFATVIAACRDKKVFWKATGGLHHPWRHELNGVRSHGFLNVAIAAAMAMVRGLDAATIESILADEQASHFQIDDHTIAWKDHSLTAAQVAAARTASFRSFGSCSFDEPRQDLKDLGWL